MKLVLISDTHGQHRKFDIPEGDVLIHAGDFMRSGMYAHEIVDFNDWLDSTPCPTRIVIAGNHDRLFELQYSVRSYLTNAIYLQDSAVEIDGLKFWGSPWQPEFNNWAFNVPRGAAIKKYWDLIPEGTDVLITHGPPYGILDRILPERGVEHLGCGELLKAVDRIQPRLHVFGHIHGGYGDRWDHDTLFINASLLNEQYKPANKPVVVEL